VELGFVAESKPNSPSLGSKRTVAGITLTNVTIGVMGALTAVLAARLLGPVGRGQLAAIQIWPLFLSNLALLGMSEALSYFITKYPERSRQNLSTALLICITGSIPVMLIGYVAIPLLLSHQGATVVSDAQFCLLLVPAYAVVSLAPHSFRGISNFRLWNVTRMVPTAAWLVILTAVMITHIKTGFQFSPGLLAGVFIIELACLSVPISIAAFKALRGRAKPHVRLAMPLLRYGIPALIASLPLWLNLRLDQLLIASFFSPHQLGLYAVAVAWAQVVSPLLFALGAMIVPRIASESVGHERGELIDHSIRLGIFVALLVVVPAVAVTPIAIPILFGAPFAGAIVPSVLLVIGGTLLGLNYIISQCLLSLAYLRGPVRAQFAGIVMTVITLAALLRPWGILGAAVSSVAGYGTTTIWLLVEVREQNSTPWRELLIPTKSEIQFFLKSRGR
jgi:antigen flippase